MLNVWWRVRVRAVHLLIVFAVVVTFGGLDELTQPPFGRTADWFDWYADVCGTLIGLALAAVVCRYLERFRSDRQKPQD
jgi:VanZ family protein